MLLKKKYPHVALQRALRVSDSHSCKWVDIFKALLAFPSCLMPSKSLSVEYSSKMNGYKVKSHEVQDFWLVHFFENN